MKYTLKSSLATLASLLVWAIIIFSPINELQARDLYLQTFGNADHVPVLFLHGGPGYNCASFEVTTAQRLADQGFFVIAYDRRGEGRSRDKNARYTFKESNKDIKSIMKTYGLKSVHLIGHSFGGITAVKFAEKNKKAVKSITLVGAPVSLQASFKSIIKTCEKIYIEKKDETNLDYIRQLYKMDSNSLQYSSYCFMHAMQCGFYSCKNPNPLALSLYKLFSTDTVLINNASKMGYKEPKAFWENEAYTTLDLKEALIGLKNNGLPIFGLYGKEDGLYAPAQISELSEIIGESNLLYLDDCSHSVFIDQQAVFIASLSKWLK